MWTKLEWYNRRVINYEGYLCTPTNEPDGDKNGLNVSWMLQWSIDNVFARWWLIPNVIYEAIWQTCLICVWTWTWHRIPSVSFGCKILVRCLYHAANFLQNSHKRHSIAHPLGRDMECLLCVETLFIFRLNNSITTLVRVISAPDCNPFRNFNSGWENPVRTHMSNYMW